MTIPEGWKITSYKDIADINSDSIKVDKFEHDTIQYIDIASIQTTGKIEKPAEIKLDEAPSRAKRIVHDGDILVSTVRPYLRSFAYVEEASDNLIASTGYAVLSPKSKVDGKFIYQTILTSRFIDNLNARLRGSNYPAVSSKDVGEMLLLLPSLPEQKKIAEILGSVDEAIQATQETIEQTKRVKKGLLQDLLTKGIGHTRFKKTEIGEIPEEWEVMKLEDLSNIRRGASPRPIRDPKWFADEGRGWVRIEDVTGQGKYLRTTKQRLSKLGVEKSVPINPGDLIMSICATIGVPSMVEMQACIHDGFVLFQDISDRLLRPYLYYSILNRRNSFTSKGQPGTQKNINTSIVKNVRIPMPSLSEQRQITNVLDSIDDLIGIEESSFGALEELKKGLMQDLLTGDVRVTT